jgi:hypothetical protein
MTVNSLYDNRYLNFFKKKTIHSEFNDLLKKNLKEPIILNSIKSPLSKDFCKIISELNNIPFKEYTFDYFMKHFPHINNDNSLLYINDFLIGYGRILNKYEEDILSNLCKNTNLLVFHADNIKEISFKDNNIIRYFQIIDFSDIKKKEIVQFILDTIQIKKYNDDLFYLNWIKYDIEKLDFEKINMLLHDLNELYFTLHFKYSDYNINLMINSYIV